MTQMSIQDAIELAKRAQQSGDLRRAESIYRQVLSVQPEHPEALHLLGLVELQSGRSEMARELIERAIRAMPAAAHFHSNLGLVLAELKQWDESVAAYERALSLHADFPQARTGLAQARAKLGESLHDQGRVEEAIDAYHGALAVQPDQLEALNNLGAALLETGRPGEAVAPLQQALKQLPEYGEAQANLGMALRDLRRIDEAMEVYRAAAARYPQWHVPQYSMGMLMLLRGEFTGAWPLLESRWGAPEMQQFLGAYTRPKWQGQPLEDLSIVLHAEQGFGDAIQFVRYAPQIIGRARRVILACASELLSLLQANIPGVDQWITPGQPMPEYDVHCSLMSLPMMFDTTEATIPRTVPYLRADPALSSKWRERIGSISARRKVGIVWAGRPTHRQDRLRSISPTLLAPLAQVPDVALISLQVGREPPTHPGFEMRDWTSELKDFSDTAALIDNLDLVITVDTAIAHLAGAMGKPVWVMLPCVPDWRWMLDRDDSPWYPTMRLFRQQLWGDWAEVIQRVTDALGSFQANQR